MFPKCANPECTLFFGNLREGNLFRFRRDHSTESAPANSHSVEHAWLCAKCCEQFTLEYRNSRVALVPLAPPVQLALPVAERMPLRKRRGTRGSRRPRPVRAPIQNGGTPPVVVLAITPSGDFPERS
jgi:hypothetical protein